MILFRKTFSTIVSLSMLMGTMNFAIAKDESSERTAHSYENFSDKKEFCDGAEKSMDDLNFANKADMVDMEGFRGKIDELVAKQNTLIGVNAIKNEYLTSLRNLRKQGTAKPAEQNSSDGLGSNLDNLKSTIRNGLLLSAIKQMVLKKDDISNQSIGQMCNDSVCKGALAAETLITGTQHQIFPGLTSKPNGENHYLTKALKDFQEVFVKAGTANKEDLSKQIASIIDGIPAKVSPQIILSMIAKKAPTLITVLNSTNSKDLIMECLSESSKSSEACKKLGDDSSKNGLAAILKSEIPQIPYTLEKQKAFEALDANILSNTDSINKSMNTFVAEQKDGTMSDYSQEALRNADIKKAKLEGLERIFYKAPRVSENQLPEQRDSEVSKALAQAKADVEEWTSRCNKPVPADYNFCQTRMNYIEPKLEVLNDEFQRNVDDLQNKMNAIKNKAKFANIEILKKYIAEKYISLKCSDSDPRARRDDINMSFLNKIRDIKSGCTPMNNQEVTKVDDLGNNVSSIFKSKFYSKLSLDKAESTSLSSTELNSLKEACEELKTDLVPSVCTKTIASEIPKKEPAAEETQSGLVAKLERLQKGNSWVVYDQSEPNGYKLVAKKSRMRVVAEGFLPTAIPMLVPAWFGNFQMKQNINMLTDQALYQKQYLYNVETYNNSPWMQPNYFNSINFLSGYNADGSTRTTVGLSTTSTTTGFAF